MSFSGSQMSSRPPPNPEGLKAIDSKATFPVRIIRSAQEILRRVSDLLDRQSSRRRPVEAHISRASY